jgi:hypothetical protein
VKMDCVYIPFCNDEENCIAGFSGVRIRAERLNLSGSPSVRMRNLENG